MEIMLLLWTAVHPEYLVDALTHVTFHLFRLRRVWGLRENGTDGQSMSRVDGREVFWITFLFLVG